MIDEHRYMFLLQLEIIIEEEVKEKKRKKKQYSNLQRVSDKLKNIIDYYESIM